MTVDEGHDAGLDDLEDDQPVTRIVGGRAVLLVRRAGRLHATDGHCPHKFALLAEGTFHDGCVTCPQHEATFDLATGSAGPDGGWAGHLPVHRVTALAGRLRVYFSS